jgi:hypothetical protein
MLENPPEEKAAAVSGERPVVAPTDVTKGQGEGNVGTNAVQTVGWKPPTPPPPEDMKMVVPRAPNCMKELHTELGGTHQVSPAVSYPYQIKQEDSPSKPSVQFLLVEPIRSRPNKRKNRLALHRVGDADKPADIIRVDCEERRWDARGDTDGILDVEVGFETGRLTGGSLGNNVVVDPHGGKTARAGKIGTEYLEESLG